jgi:hypothetical protein
LRLCRGAFGRYFGNVLEGFQSVSDGKWSWLVSLICNMETMCKIYVICTCICTHYLWYWSHILTFAHISSHTVQPSSKLNSDIVLSSLNCILHSWLFSAQRCYTCWDLIIKDYFLTAAAKCRWYTSTVRLGPARDGHNRSEGFASVCFWC